MNTLILLHSFEGAYVDVLFLVNLIYINNTCLQAGSSAGSEFDNIWKQLQASQPAEDTSSQGTSLSKAAAVLPTVPCPETDFTKGSDSIQNATKIDVQSLFSGACISKDMKEKPGSQSGSSDGNVSTRSTKVVSNDEFAAMFKSLEEVQISQEAKDREAEVRKDQDLRSISSKSNISTTI